MGRGSHNRRRDGNKASEDKSECEPGSDPNSLSSRAVLRAKSRDTVYDPKDYGICGQCCEYDL
jgi:hypothetical protein